MKHNSRTSQKYAFLHSLDDTCWPEAALNTQELLPTKISYSSHKTRPPSKKTRPNQKPFSYCTYSLILIPCS